MQVYDQIESSLLASSKFANLSKQLASNLWIKTLDNQFESSLLATCNRLYHEVNANDANESWYGLMAAMLQKACCRLAAIWALLAAYLKCCNLRPVPGKIASSKTIIFPPLLPCLKINLLCGIVYVWPLILLNQLDYYLLIFMRW